MRDLVTYSELSIVNWLSVAAAMAIGPAFMVVGYQMNLAYGAGGAVYMMVCAGGVPMVIIFAGRLRYVAWQLAAVSFALSIFIDNLRMDGDPLGHIRQLMGVGVMFWLASSALSGPLPLALFLVGLQRRRRARLDQTQTEASLRLNQIRRQKLPG
jgi:hypothetical protein